MYQNYNYLLLNELNIYSWGEGSVSIALSLC